MFIALRKAVARWEPACRGPGRAGWRRRPATARPPRPGRLDLDERAAAVGRVRLPVDEAGPVEVGQHAADRGQGQAEERGELADGDGPAAQLLQRRDVPGPERGARARRDPVLPAPHAPRHAREQLHEPQAQRRVLPAACFVAHAALLDQTPHSLYIVPLSKLFLLTNKITPGARHGIRATGTARGREARRMHGPWTGPGPRSGSAPRACGAWSRSRASSARSPGRP